jgi:hypothetical protein
MRTSAAAAYPQDQDVIAGERRQAGGCGESDGQRAQRPRQRADEVVRRKDARAPRVARGLRQDRLLDGEKRPDLLAGGADRPEHRREGEQGHARGGGEQRAACRHQRRADDQHAPAAQPVCDGRQGHCHNRTRGERGGEEGANKKTGEPQSGQVGAEHDGQEAEGKEAHGAGGEQQPPVPRKLEPPSRWQSAHVARFADRASSSDS